MLIKTMTMKSIKPADYNPRKALKPGDFQFEKIRRSIETFGNVEPIVWNERTGNIVGGHQRYEVLKGMGIKETEVSVINVSPEEEKLLNVALNKIKGEWDFDKLTEILDEFDGNSEITLSGFSPQEIAILCADANAAAEEVIDNTLESFDEEEEEETPSYYGGEPETDEDPSYVPDYSEGQESANDYSGASEISSNTMTQDEINERDGVRYCVQFVFVNGAADAVRWLVNHGLDDTIHSRSTSKVLAIEE